LLDPPEEDKNEEVEESILGKARVDPVEWRLWLNEGLRLMLEARLTDDLGDSEWERSWSPRLRST
jgi:hypothetical protein